jgi:hypothetical protein
MTFSIMTLINAENCYTQWGVTYKPFMLSVIMLSVIMLSVIMLSVIMLSIIMLSVVMQNVFMLNVVAPSKSISKVLTNIICMNCFTNTLNSFRKWPEFQK